MTVGTAGGREAAARTARYAALDAVADALGRDVLLGHTLDDQAETVLLGLGRGSGPRSIAGMRPRSGRYLRPLLGVRRATTEAACRALGLDCWDDPHNDDRALQRVRLRREVLPLLEDVLQGGVAEALARTAVLTAGRPRRARRPGRSTTRARPARRELSDVAALAGAAAGGAHPGAARVGARRAARPRSPPSTSSAWTRWSPTGTARRRIDATRRCRRPPARLGDSFADAPTPRGDEL